jgi:pimeloyl-ACP methyl ester carboxylesterase
VDIVLIAGLWLPVSMWDDVARHLERLGHRPLPVALPGVDDRSTTATLADQLDAALTVVDSANRPMVVGHSAACTLAWMVADRRPDAVAGVVLVGGFPSGDGSAYADFFPLVDGVMPFPGWAPFEGADTVDLDDADRSRIASEAVAVPGGVAFGIVGLGDERRFDVPVLLVCPEYSPDQARAWIDGGEVSELVRAERVTYVDIDSGHWPMVTRPAELASILDEAGRGIAMTTGEP